MGKTFEALERAKKESRESSTADLSNKRPDRDIESFPEKAEQEDAPELSKELQKRGVTAFAELVHDPTAMERSYELKTNLLTRHLHETIRSILFVGTSPGDGTSTVGLNYATLLSQDTGRMVLFVDSDVDLNGVSIKSHASSETGLPQIFLDDDSGEKKGTFSAKKMGQGNLYFLVFGREDVKYAESFESDRIDRFLEMAYERFDDIIIAAPSVSTSARARAFCAKVDGIVMVISSGRTRRQIAVKTKQTVENAGGIVSGVVLNRRKYYIPEWIYRRL